VSIRSLVLTLLIVLIGWWWVRARDLKELVQQTVQRRCEALSLSLLDQTIALRRLRLARNARGQWALLRTYQFDFSATGEDRYQGYVEVLGRQVLKIHLPPHRIDH
jgi:hypothetical protein